MHEEPMTEFMEEAEVKKSSLGKKIGCSCGCGCLLMILLVVGLFFWGYNYVSSFVTTYEEQGYEMVEVQALVIGTDEVVQGPVFYFGQSVTINGTIEGDVAAMCQALTINGTINGNMDLLCQAVTITESGVVTGDIVAEGVQVLTVDGTVEGKITGAIQVRE